MVVQTKMLFRLTDDAPAKIGKAAKERATRSGNQGRGVYPVVWWQCENALGWTPHYDKWQVAARNLKKTCRFPRGRVSLHARKRVCAIAWFVELVCLQSPMGITGLQCEHDDGDTEECLGTVGNISRECYLCVEFGYLARECFTKGGGERDW